MRVTQMRGRAGRQTEDARADRHRGGLVVEDPKADMIIEDVVLGHGLVGRRHAAETARVVLRLHCVQRRGWHQFILWQHERRTGCTHGHGAQAYTM